MKLKATLKNADDGQMADRISALDGVRGVALVLVFGVHAQPDFFVGGGIGVDLFFVLSGFLITSILLREYARSGTINLLNFYTRRALRLFPALFLYVIVVVAYVALFDRSSLPAVLNDAAWVAAYIYNWLRDLTLHSSERLYSMFGHLWSLSVEEQFYILWPGVVILALRSSQPARNFGLVLLSGIIAPAVARLLFRDPSMFLWGYFRTDLRCDSLMWGAASAWLLHHGCFDHLRSSQRFKAMAIRAFAGMMVMSLFNLFNSGILSRGGYTLLGLLSSIVIIHAAIGNGGLNRLLETPWLRYTGKISYGLYIIHLAAFHAAYQLTALPILMQTAIGIALSFMVASVSYRCWESPFLRLKQRFVAHGPAQLHPSTHAMSQ